MTNREKARQNLSRKAVIKQLKRLSNGFKHVGDELNCDVLLAAADWLKEFDDLMERWCAEQIERVKASGCCCENRINGAELRGKEETDEDDE